MPVDKAPLLAKAEEPFQVVQTAPTALLLNPLAWLLWILDFLVWLLTIVGPIKFLMSLVPKEHSFQKCSSWRSTESKDALISEPAVNMNTVHLIMQNAFTKYKDKHAVGTREYKGEHKLENARFPLKKFGATKWTTFDEFGKDVKAFGAGLINLGMQPLPADKKLEDCTGAHAILIYEETCQQWTLAAHGAFSQSIVVATSYATLGISAVADSIKETNATAIVCNIKDVQKVASYCGDKCPSLKTIICSTNNSTDTKLPEVDTKFKVLSVADVVELGKKQPRDFTPPTPEHLAVIMYTSGSTGKPKGVMIKHKSMAASIGGIKARCETFGLMAGSDETYLAYLPAAHIMELVLQSTCLACGFRLGFCCPKTISSKGACRERPDGSVNTAPGYPYPPGGIQEFQPSIMGAVPKVWDLMKKSVEEVVGKGSPLKKWIFQAAFTARNWAVHQGRDTPLFKVLVFNKLNMMFGGKLKFCCSGGGAISADVQNFIRIGFCVPIVQGYALTETCCAGCVQYFGDIRDGIAGCPVGSVEITLRSCIGSDGLPEVLDRKMKPYLAEDTSHYGDTCIGRGEVLIRGPSVSSGYFKQPEKTKEAFDEEGWFHSGDVAIFTPDGSLKIVDRVKNLVKLKGGEYIALEAMEKEYGTSPFVDPAKGGIMCYGDATLDKPLALVQANTHELEKWAKASGISYSSVEELCKLSATEKMVMESLTKAGKAGNLGANEFLAAVALIPGTGTVQGDMEATSPWTPENGGLTASNKLNRQPIQVAYASLLEPMKKHAIR